MKDLLAAARTCFLSKTAHLAKLSLARDAPRRQNRDSNAASDKRALFFVSLEATPDTKKSARARSDLLTFRRKNIARKHIYKELLRSRGDRGSVGESFGRRNSG